MPATSACPRAEEWRRYLLGQLLETDGTRLDQHLAGCAVCLAALASVNAADPLLDSLFDEVRTPSVPDTAVDEALLVRIYALAPSSYFPEQTGELTALLDAPGAADELGRIGPYGILRVLGRGGMGIVFAARQDQPRRLVALKMLDAGVAPSQERLERFRAESEMLARLSHPQIIRVLAVGEHQGRPYFTTEYAAGGSLAQKLAQATLPPRAAAALVEALVRTVAVAHAQGIVHRDLKPSNVLLAGDGTPLIADFGLAKQLADADALAAVQTASGAILGTPSYMAPEQAAGANEVVGPASDVYALGAILYECLTGRPPFKAVSLLETLEQVRSQEPVPPRRLQPGVPRDLETICVKCLQKAPARRYPTAQALADDLGRFLRGEPIRARPVSMRERLAKWARRKPALAALLVVTGLALVAVVAGTLVYDARLRAAVAQAQAKEAETRRQYREAHDALDRMLGRLGDKRLAEVPRLKELQRGLLEDALAFYQGVLQQADSPDPAVRRDAAVACRRAADIQQALGQWQAAAENYRRAIELVAALPAEEREAFDTQVLLAGCYQNWGTAVGRGGRLDEAEQHCRKALDIREHLARTWPDDPVQQNELATAEHALAVVYHDRKPSEAESHYDRAVAIRTALVRDHAEAEGYQAALAEDYANLGLLYRRTGRDAKTTAIYGKAEDLLRPLVDRHPAEARYALSLVAVYVDWSYLLARAGRSQEALDRLDRAVRLAEAALRKEPQDTTCRQRALAAHGARAEISEFLGRFADSVKEWDRVVELTDGPARRRWRGTRARVLTRAADHTRAAAEAGELAALSEATGDDLYFLARVYVLAMAPARGDSRLPAAERERLAGRYAAQAMALLQRLQGQGYFKDAAHAKALRTDEELQPLRGREDFTQLLAAVQAK